jgi:prepilin peptidase CpaA
LQLVVLPLGIGLFAAVAYGDLTRRRIPNALAAAVAALGLVRILLTGDITAALYTIAASGAVFVATFLLFWRGLLGGGDVKLMSATALVVGYPDLPAFLFVMSVCGALISLAVLASHKFAARCATASSVQQPQDPPAKLTVPYGVAIAVAGIFTLLVQSFFPG